MLDSTPGEREGVERPNDSVVAARQSHSLTFMQPLDDGAHALDQSPIVVVRLSQ
jgi:hypothetical protein